MEKGTHGVVGDTLNLASRLSDIAGPDEILVSPQTRELIIPYFKTKSMGAVTIKGKDNFISLKIVVEDKDIGYDEIVTAFLLRDMKNESSKGRIIYDSGSTSKS